jgi:pimeloyl-ACP methyl ester carboxylesterase
MPNARLELVTDAGHFPHWEQPEAFVDKLAAFVEGNR